MLAYNRSASSTGRKPNLRNLRPPNGRQVAISSSPGWHSLMWFMFDLAQDYVARGMSAYVEKVQEPEFAAHENAQKTRDNFLVTVGR
jgi:isocitrate lyase